MVNIWFNVISPPTKIYVVFVVRFVVQTMKFHAKPGKWLLLVLIFSHIQKRLRQIALEDRHALIGLYRALIARILYGLKIFQLILHKSIFESFPPSREEILAVHNWGVKNSTNPIKVIEPRKKQASTVRKNKKTIST